MGKWRGAYRFLEENPRAREDLEEQNVDERTIQNGSSKSGMGRHGLD
jgi:hypothetical protein